MTKKYYWLEYTDHGGIYGDYQEHTPPKYPDREKATIAAKSFMKKMANEGDSRKLKVVGPITEEDFWDGAIF